MVEAHGQPAGDELGLDVAAVLGGDAPDRPAVDVLVPLAGLLP